MMELNITEEQELALVTELFENFPEASQYNALSCTNWDYEDLTFTFEDTETGKTHIVFRDQLIKGFRRFLELVLLQKTNLSMNPLEWDADTSDAVAQCAIFNDIIYG